MDWSKIPWSQEQAQRVLEAEGFNQESRWVGARYTRDAESWRDFNVRLSPGVVMLPNVPAVDQLTSHPPKGVDQNKFNNCGPACCSMVIEHVTDVRFWPDQFTDAWYGTSYTGYTETDKLAEILRQQGNIETSSFYPGNIGDASNIIRSVLDIGLISIGLVYWQLNQPQSGHFVTYYGYDDYGVYRVNPWGGIYEHQSWADFWRWNKNYLIVSNVMRRVV